MFGRAVSAMASARRTEADNLASLPGDGRDSDVRAVNSATRERQRGSAWCSHSVRCSSRQSRSSCVTTTNGSGSFLRTPFKCAIRSAGWSSGGTQLHVLFTRLSDECSAAMLGSMNPSRLFAPVMPLAPGECASDLSTNPCPECALFGRELHPARTLIRGSAVARSTNPWRRRMWAKQGHGLIQRSFGFRRQSG